MSRPATVSPAALALLREAGFAAPGEADRSPAVASAEPAAAPTVEPTGRQARPRPEPVRLKPLEPEPPADWKRYGDTTAALMEASSLEPDDLPDDNHREGLGRVKARLARIVNDPNADTSDIISAAREMVRIDGIRDSREAGKPRKLRTVAEIDQDIATTLRALGWQVTPPGA